MAIQLIKYIEQIKKKTIDVRNKKILTLIMCVFQDFIYIIKIHQNKKHNKNTTITKTKKINK
jgi:energy-converting hydrogenase A subunit M